MIFGTDAGVYPHGDNARQFAKMVAMGNDPAAGDPGGDESTLRAALDRGDVGTISPRHLWRHHRGQGATRRSMLRVLEHVNAVIKGGQLINVLPDHDNDDGAGATQ